MKTITYKASFVITALFIISGCSSTPKQEPPTNPFAAVRTIELRDKTDPVLLASTTAKRISELIEVGLVGRGYSVCREGPSDAVATVTIHSYKTEQDSKRDWLDWMNVHYVTIAESDWTLTITRNGETIFQKRMDDNETMPLDQLAGQQVQSIIRRIPERQKETVSP